MQAWEEKVIEVIDKYEPDLLWFDSGLQRKKFWRSSLQEFDGHKRSFLSYYYNKGLKLGKEVGVTYKDEDLPKGAGILDFERGRNDALSEFIWLTDTSIDEKSWSYVENPRYKPVNELVDILVVIVSKNGCLLLNVGPRADGTFPDEVKKRLLELGDWLKINGEAIYGTRPWVKYGEGPTKQRGGAFSEKKNKVSYTAKDIRFTTRGDVLYTILLDHPRNEETVITSLSKHNQIRFGKVKSVSLLGSKEQIQWKQTNDGLMITAPRDYNGSYALTFKIIPK
jgi:alpha-L-fucosidase